MVIKNQTTTNREVIALLNMNFIENYIDNENAQNLSPEMKKVWDEMFVCHERIRAIVSTVDTRRSWDTTADIAVPVAAYLLAKASEYIDPVSVTFDALESSCVVANVMNVARHHNLDKVWDELKELISQHKYNVFCLVTQLQETNNYSDITPEGITDLASEILSVKAGERVADYCCGTGTFAKLIKSVVPDADVTGYEVNQEAVIVEAIRNDLYNDGINMISADVFSLVTGEHEKPVYDKIFANYPFGQRMRELDWGKEYLDHLAKRIPSMSKATSSDWLYNMLMIDTLSATGKAIGIMTNGGTWNMIDAPIRKYFVENGLIECVIALPARLFNTTNIATTMIVFSHGNKVVRLVNASEQFTAGRRVNELSEANVKVILQACTEDSDISMQVSLDDLRDNDYVLSTSRYTHGAETIEDGAPFETVIKRITRGAPLNASQLDAISSAAPTDMQYLMLSNIQNGLIDTNLPYLSVIDKKNEKYCLSNHCLILSKNGYPYKIAVAEVREGQKIMANGNLYIIELDEEKANPYYLAAFFGSEQGTAALKSITVGATIPNIGVDQLKKLIIPLPGIDRQNEIADRYQAVKDEITLLQLKLEKAKNRMMHICEEGV